MARGNESPGAKQDEQNEVLDKHGVPISTADTVFKRLRGGKHEGQVDKIVYAEEEAHHEGVKNPPKVLFTDQHGHHVSHNPGTLSHVDKKD
ncbi:hypothetical protein V8F33_010860 [Rhypophila sp. PSN 637]